MPDFDGIPGLGSGHALQPAEQQMAMRVVHTPLQRILAFTGHSIDDVINDSYARNRVTAYFKLHRWINRGVEIRELERQWNPLGLRG